MDIQVVSNGGVGNNVWNDEGDIVVSMGCSEFYDLALLNMVSLFKKSVEGLRKVIPSESEEWLDLAFLVDTPNTGPYLMENGEGHHKEESCQLYVEVSLQCRG